MVDFGRAVDSLVNDPSYPESSTLLAKLFRRILRRAEIVLMEIEVAITQDMEFLRNLLKEELTFRQWRTIKKMPLPALLTSGQDLLITRKGKDSKEARLFENRMGNIAERSNHVAILVRYFRELMALLRYIETSSVSEAPISLIATFTRKATKRNPKHFIFLRRQWSPNCKYGEFVHQISEPRYIPRKLKSMFSDIDIKISMVSYPISLQDNYLLSSLVVHEVGHYFDSLLPFVSEREKTKLLVSLPSDLQDELLEDEDSMTDIASIAHKWVCELIADIYATFLMGPAYLLSLFEFESQRQNLDLDRAYTDTEYNHKRAYPSLRMRLYFIVTVLKRPEVNILTHIEQHKDSSCWFRSLHDFLSSIKELVEIDYDKDVIQKFDDRISWIALQAKEKEIVDHSLRNLTADGTDMDLLFTHRDLSPDALAKAKDRLDRMIPIGEMLGDRPSTDDSGRLLYDTEPVPVPTILNFGWMKYLSLKNEAWNSVEEVPKQREAYTKLLGVIKRSIDASYIHTEYLNYRVLLEE